MRLVFFGSGAFGLPTLEALARDHDVAMVVTQPDKPAGRDQRPTPTPVGERAAERLAPRGTPIIKPERVNDASVVEQIRGAPADAWVVIAFGQKLGKPLLEGRFAINLHASLLPRWRGAAPINHAILAGDAETGNSVIALADRMDAGVIYGRSHRVIPPAMTAGELHDALGADGPALVLRVLEERHRGAERGEAQDESLFTLAGKLRKTDGWVDFSRPAEECRRRINGLSPWPGVSVSFRGEPVKLLRAEAVSTGAEQGDVAPLGTPPGITPGISPGTPAGAIIDPIKGIVACGGGTALRVLDAQAAGKRAMMWEEFARGKRIARGEVLEGA